MKEKRTLWRNQKSHNPIWFVSRGLRGTHASYSRDHRYFYLMEEMATVLQSENLVHIVNGNCEGSDTLRRRLSEIKHFPVVGCEVISPSQDCVWVLYSTWKRVGAAKVCVWILVTVGIINNDDVAPETKYWTITWAPVNCVWWLSHQALEWSKAFFVAKWKYECIGSVTPATTGL